MLTVVTSFSPALYEQVGHRCVESFSRYWPSDAELICYWEKCSNGLLGYDLLDLEPCKSFLQRHEGNPVVAGKKPRDGCVWGPKARAQGYNFKFDAYKFARKVFAVAHAARCVNKGRLFWLDADIVTNAPVTEDLLKELLPDSVSLCYLPRERYHSETGFVGYNLDRQETHSFLEAFESLYALDAFMQVPQWTDSYIFDWLVAHRKPAVKHIPHNSMSQPFDDSELGSFMTHLKGKRKEAA